MFTNGGLTPKCEIQPLSNTSPICTIQSFSSCLRLEQQVLPEAEAARTSAGASMDMQPPGLRWGPLGSPSEAAHSSCAKICGIVWLISAMLLSRPSRICQYNANGFNMNLKLLVFCWLPNQTHLFEMNSVAPTSKKLAIIANSLHFIEQFSQLTVDAQFLTSAMLFISNRGYYIEE